MISNENHIRYLQRMFGDDVVVEATYLGSRMAFHVVEQGDWYMMLRAINNGIYVDAKDITEISSVGLRLRDYSKL